MAYKIGDTVKIRTDLVTNKDYYVDHSFVGLTEEMQEFAGQEAIVTKVHDDSSYSIDIDNGEYYWEDMFFEHSDGDFRRYKRKGFILLRPYVEGEDLPGVSISVEDENNGSPKLGDMIAKNPNNPSDMWLVNAEYFKNNYE